MEKFELFMGYLGNGITVCNKAVTENGDYKKIAHIAECGKIHWYVCLDQYVPGNELLKIEHAANVQSERWNKWLMSIPMMQQYAYLLNRVPHADFMHIMRMDSSIWDKIQYLKQAYYNTI